MYVLDTNTVIYYFKNQGQVTQRLVAVQPQEIILSTIVLFELQVGIAKSTSPTKRIQQLQQFLSRVTPTPYRSRCSNGGGYNSCSVGATGNADRSS